MWWTLALPALAAPTEIADAPEVTVHPQVPLGSSRLRQVLSPHLKTLATCWETPVSRRQPVGRVVIALDIDTRGQVQGTHSSGSLAETELARCLSKKLAAVDFPPAMGSQTLEVPFVFGAPAHTDHLLPFDAEREALTKAYLERHCPEATPTMEPDTIVLHGTSDATLDAARERFVAAALPDESPLNRAGALNVGAHWLVGRDGTIWKLAEETQVLRHTIGLNHRSIAIENVGDGPGHPLTEAQVEANRSLVDAIRSRWPIQQVVGHFEANGLDDLCEADPDYWGLPLDPGPAFVEAVRR